MGSSSSSRSACSTRCNPSRTSRQPGASRQRCLQDRNRDLQAPDRTTRSVRRRIGGMNYIRFNPGHSVAVEPVAGRGLHGELEQRAMLVYTGRQRKRRRFSRDSRMARPIGERPAHMRDLADELRKALVGENLEQVARCPQRLGAEAVTGVRHLRPIDRRRVCAAPKAKRRAASCWAREPADSCCSWPRPSATICIRDTVNRPQELPFRIDRNGSRVVFVSDLH